MKPRSPEATHRRLLVCLLQGVVRRDAFASYADLKEAVRCRCAALHIPYTEALITGAIDELERGGQYPLVAVPVQRRHVEVVEPQLGLSRDDSVATLTEVFARLERDGVV